MGQLGSSVGAALSNTIAATVTAGYLAGHPTVRVVTATVHGFNVAMIRGALVLLAAAIPIALFVNARPRRRSPDEVRPIDRSSIHPPP